MSMVCYGLLLIIIIVIIGTSERVTSVILQPLSPLVGGHKRRERLQYHYKQDLSHLSTYNYAVTLRIIMCKKVKINNNIK